MTGKQVFEFEDKEVAQALLHTLIDEGRIPNQKHMASIAAEARTGWGATGFVVKLSVRPSSSHSKGGE